MSRERILLTGASGFVGRAVWPALTDASYDVRGVTRNKASATRRWPERDWVEADLDVVEDLAPVLDGCAVALYLVHGMHGPDFRQREIRQAQRFASAASRSGVRRIVYLGGVAPAGPPSEHLRSRLEVGEALRAGHPQAVELRASMIVGHGSISWMMVRDLAARLPAMVLPRWLHSLTEPIAIEDVVAGLVASIDVPLQGSALFDIPGPDRLTGRAILEETAQVLGLRRPAILEVPLLSPWLSSHWVRLVTRADWSVARELVLGLNSDLIANDGRFWELTDRRDRLIPFAEAARRALQIEQAEQGSLSGLGGAVERLVRRSCRR
jgi:uncharacterized protein YbjT (DUF2867 family)